MRSSMARLVVTCSLALLGGFMLTDGASACGRRCANVAPAGQLPCLRCIDDPGSTSDCRNSSGSCGCIFLACQGFSAVVPEEDALVAEIFSSGPAQCSVPSPWSANSYWATAAR